jgi:phage terminase small subunit
MGRKFVDRQPGEIQTFCEGHQVLRDANKLLKPHGLVIRWRGHLDMRDQIFIRLERRATKSPTKVSS